MSTLGFIIFACMVVVALLGIALASRPRAKGIDGGSDDAGPVPHSSGHHDHSGFSGVPDSGGGHHSGFSGGHDFGGGIPGGHH